MRSRTSKNRGWLRKTTAAGMIPLLLAQVLIALVWVPQTLEAKSEIRRELPWKGLPYLFYGDYTVTIMLTKGGAVRSDAVTVLDNSIHLHRITMATDSKRFPWGSETSIARGAVKEIRVEKMVGNARRGGLLLGIGGGLLLPTAFGVREWGEWSGAKAVGVIVGIAAVPVGGGIVGYLLGKQLDRETTIITIAD